MAYIGRSVDVGMFEKQVITADSSTTTFTLTFAVGSANSLLVVYGGVIQEPAVAYSVSGGGQQIVFSEAPVTGTTTYIIYLGKQLTTPRAAGQETTKQTFAGDGSTTLFTLTDPPVVPAGIMVFVDGILQREGSGNNYVSGGSTISFTSAPDASAEIDVYTLVKEKVSIDTVADGSITRAKMAATFPYWTAGGNFGIGAATPTSKLHIADDGDTALTIQSITGSGQSPSIRLQRGTYGTDGFNDVRIYNTTGGLYVDNINASNEATNLLTATTTGLGIGTTTPSSKLEVAGALTLTSVALPAAGTARLYSRNTDNNLYIQTGSGNILYLLEGSQNTMYAAGPTLHAWQINNSEKMRLDSVGRFFVGTAASTTSSSQSGEVYSTGAVGFLFTNTTAANYGLSVKNQGTSETRNLINFYEGAGGGTARANISFDGSNNFAITASNATTFTNGGSEKMRITSAGEVLIGYTNAGSGGKLVVNGITYQNQTANGNSGTPVVSGGYLIGPNDPNIYAGIRALNSYLSNNSSQLAFYVTNTTGSAYEAGRFDASGRLSINGYYAYSNTYLAVNVNGGNGSQAAMGVFYNGSNLANQQATYYVGSTSNSIFSNVDGNGNPRNAINIIAGGSGGVQLTSTATSWSAYSDSRLKNVTGTYTNALEDVSQLEPVKFTWKSDLENKPQVGIIAQSVEGVVPEAISQNTISANDQTEYLTVRYTELIPLLTAAIQELKAIVDAQAVEIAALKAK